MDSLERLESKKNNAGRDGAIGQFDLSDDVAYRAWRTKKRQSYPARFEDLVVKITNPGAPTASEMEAILSRCQTYNMAIYATRPDASKLEVLKMVRNFGLKNLDSPRLTNDDDGITELEVIEGGRRRAYIPYSNLPLSWHTDGYYNAPTGQVRSFLLHCVRPAKHGGISKLLDPEIAYIRLRDEDPAIIAALMAANAMTIPANREDGILIRPDESGPVFSVVAERLHMRYTHRRKNVIWKDDKVTAHARTRLRAILEVGDDYVFSGFLQPGQGLLCNNVLHARSGFEDYTTQNTRRLIYRARYLERVREPTELEF